jgi:hypothetical protein
LRTISLFYVSLDAWDDGVRQAQSPCGWVPVHFQFCFIALQVQSREDLVFDDRATANRVFFVSFVPWLK